MLFLGFKYNIYIRYFSVLIICIYVYIEVYAITTDFCVLCVVYAFLLINVGGFWEHLIVLVIVVCIFLLIFICHGYFESVFDFEGGKRGRFWGKAHLCGIYV